MPMHARRERPPADRRRRRCSRAAARRTTSEQFTIRCYVLAALGVMGCKGPGGLTTDRVGWRMELATAK
jgi:hypothetical protein